MPVTPFHFGPGLALKAGAGRWLSFGTFVAVQCVIDIESVLNLMLQRYPIHDHLHTMPGALAVAAVVTVLGKSPLSRLNGWIRRRGIVALGQRHLAPTRAAALQRIADGDIDLDAEFQPLSWTAAAVGAVLGSVTHVLLDAIIHPDVRPFAPLTERNALWVSGSFVWLHVGCVLAGVVGLVGWWLALRHRHERSQRRPTS